jgi:hypothetical protein
VTFTDKSQIHEIPPKPKRTPRNPDKRSHSAPNSKQSVNTNNTSVDDIHIETVDLSQRASVTSLEDLKKNQQNMKPANAKDLEALDKVRKNSKIFSNTQY